MSLKWIFAGLAALLAALIVYAWIDGGEESLRPIAQPVTPPALPPPTSPPELMPEPSR